MLAMCTRIIWSQPVLSGPCRNLFVWCNAFAADGAIVFDRRLLVRSHSVYVEILYEPAAEMLACWSASERR